MKEQSKKSAGQKMKVYLLTRTLPQPPEEDIYVGAVVVASNKAAARMIHPDGQSLPFYSDSGEGGWVPFSEVRVRLVGDAVSGLRQGVLAASTYCSALEE